MVLVYLDTEDSILRKSKDTSFHVLFYIIRQMDSEKNIWYADKINKELIIKATNLTMPTLDKAIASLKARELLISIQKGKYQLNAEIFST